QSESEACKNMIAYLKNTEGFKMAFFKGKHMIKFVQFSKLAKRRRLREQAKEDENLKKQLEVVVDEDDDVFVEATPIGTKVPVVNYEIVLVNNKPRYKIIRADDTHQLYTSFITLLKKFDREDLEDLWKIMKARFSTSKPTNFSNDYLLVTLKTMFEKTDAQDVIWRSQQTEYGQAMMVTTRNNPNGNIPNFEAMINAVVANALPNLTAVLRTQISNDIRNGAGPSGGGGGDAIPHGMHVWFTRLASFVGAAAGDAQRQARYFKWGLKKWVLDRIVNTDYTNVAQVAAAARNIELLHESGNSNKRDRDGNRV
nr:zinc finger, CCHC-type, retrotransposon Gag domain protein [Tanacetum cinerariifolium]